MSITIKGVVLAASVGTTLGSRVSYTGDFFTTFAEYVDVADGHKTKSVVVHGGWIDQSQRALEAGTSVVSDAPVSVREAAIKATNLALRSQERLSKAQAAKAAREDLKLTAKVLGLPNHSRLIRLYRGYATKLPMQLEITKLVRSRVQGRLKSGFKKSMADQVLAWLAEPKPKFQTPLSAKQAECVAAPFTHKRY